MCELKLKLIKLIALFEYLNYVENFKAYKDILKLYKKVWSNIENKEQKQMFEEDFKPLQNIFRIFFEAVPSDDDLSNYLVEKMQEFYELKNKIILTDDIV